MRQFAEFGRVPPHQHNGPDASEFGTPRTSAYGAAFRGALRAVVHGAAPVSPGQTGGVRNIIGAVAVRPMTVKPVIQTRFAYSGILPLAQQPKVAKPQPYDLSTGRRP